MEVLWVLEIVMYYSVNHYFINNILLDIIINEISSKK
jgi:hypothetical protein